MNDTLAHYIARLIAQDLRLTSFPQNEIERNLKKNNFDGVEKIIIPHIFLEYQKGNIVRSEEE